MLRRIKIFETFKYNVIHTIQVPKGSSIIGTAAIRDKPQLFIAVDAVPQKDEKGNVLVEPLKLLIIHNDDPFSIDVGEENALQYIGSAVGDNGYRVYHVFHVFNVEEMMEDMGMDVNEPDDEDAIGMEAVEAVEAAAKTGRLNPPSEQESKNE